jgi:hypothetical protein
MRHVHRYLLLILTALLASLPVDGAWGHPITFFPGQAFCPSRTLTVGTIMMPQQQCFSVFLMRTSQRAFLGFVPAGLFSLPLGQVIGVSTSIGARIRARTLLLVPIALPVFFLPVNTIRLEAFQVEDMGGAVGIRLAEDPNTLVPMAPPSAAQGISGLSVSPSGIPVPPDAQISPPDANIPRDEAAFSGRWSGQWKTQGDSVADEGLPHLLTVQQIVRNDRFLTNERTVVVIFAWGRSSHLEVFPGWLRAEGVFQRGVLLLTLASGARASYRMGVDGTLDATYESPDFGIMRAVLSRMK